MHKNYVVNKYTSIQVLQLNTYLCIKGSINMRKSIKNNNIKFIITMYSVLWLSIFNISWKRKCILLPYKSLDILSMQAKCTIRQSKI